MFRFCKCSSNFLKKSDCLQNVCVTLNTEWYCSTHKYYECCSSQAIRREWYWLKNFSESGKCFAVPEVTYSWIKYQTTVGTGCHFDGSRWNLVNNFNFRTWYPGSNLICSFNKKIVIISPKKCSVMAFWGNDFYNVMGGFKLESQNGRENI